MAAPSPICWLNLILPGAGLVLRARPWTGYSLLLGTGIAASGAVVYALLASESLAHWLGPAVLATWLLVVLLAGVAWWQGERDRPIDQPALATAFQQAARAYLQGDHAAALQSARAVIQLAPHQPGAWQLQALAAEASGDSQLARRSLARAQHLRQRLDDG